MKRSCQTNLLESLEDWTRPLDDVNALDIAYLDFQKAFDTVPHKRLKKKLRAYDIQGRVHNWVCDFLQEMAASCSGKQPLNSEASGQRSTARFGAGPNTILNLCK